MWVERFKNGKHINEVSHTFAFSRDGMPNKKGTSYWPDRSEKFYIGCVDQSDSRVWLSSLVYLVFVAIRQPSWHDYIRNLFGPVKRAQLP
jgi:hypothetical protein